MDRDIGHIKFPFYKSSLKKVIEIIIMPRLFFIKQWLTNVNIMTLYVLERKGLHIISNYPAEPNVTTTPNISSNAKYILHYNQPMDYVSESTGHPGALGSSPLSASYFCEMTTLSPSHDNIKVCQPNCKVKQGYRYILHGDLLVPYENIRDHL